MTCWRIYHYVGFKKYLTAINIAHFHKYCTKTDQNEIFLLIFTLFKFKTISLFYIRILFMIHFRSKHRIWTDKISIIPIQCLIYHHIFFCLCIFCDQQNLISIPFKMLIYMIWVYCSHESSLRSFPVM